MSNWCLDIALLPLTWFASSFQQPASTSQPATPSQQLASQQLDAGQHQLAASQQQQQQPVTARSHCRQPAKVSSQTSVNRHPAAASSQPGASWQREISSSWWIICDHRLMQPTMTQLQTCIRLLKVMRPLLSIAEACVTQRA